MALQLCSLVEAVLSVVQGVVSVCQMPPLRRDRPAGWLAAHSLVLETIHSWCLVWLGCLVDLNLQHQLPLVEVLETTHLWCLVWLPCQQIRLTNLLLALCRVQTVHTPAQRTDRSVCVGVSGLRS